jgi:hypothetical protein
VTTPASAALTPQAFCRRILTALRQRMQPDHDSSYLEMLLTYFIDVNPSPEDFQVRLARYVTDGRPGIAEAAATVQAASRRSAPDAPLPLPPLAETLRVLGALVDEAGAEAALLEITADGVQLRMFGELSQRTLRPHEVHQESAARTVLRGRVPADDPAAAHRYEALLRTVGTLLDKEYAPSYRIMVMPGLIGVHSGTGHYVAYPLADLLAQQKAARP